MAPNPDQILENIISDIGVECGCIGLWIISFSLLVWFLQRSKRPPPVPNNDENPKD